MADQSPGRGAKPRDTPLPGGADTTMLGFLTAVSPDWERGGGRPQTIDRLFMRLRIFWFFLMAIPILIGSFLFGAAVAGVIELVVGGARGGAESIDEGIRFAGFVVGLIVLTWLFARWFNRLTRGYRARLEARALAEGKPGGRHGR